MKKLLLVIPICLLFISCTKDEEITTEQKPTTMLGRSSVFPTSVNMGNDIVSPKSDSVCLCSVSVYLNSCGFSPEYEAPNNGFTVYQIAGPNTATIRSSVVGFQSYPQVTGLIPGTYTFVGHAWVTGYRLCDDSTMNDNVYDTINVTVNRNRKKIR